MIGRCADPRDLSLDCKWGFQLIEFLKFVTQTVTAHISGIAHLPVFMFVISGDIMFDVTTSILSSNQIQYCNSYSIY
jgi:hypothetical protein